MKGKRVFVSGGAGVIGQELVPRLVAAGAVILVGDLKPRPASFPQAVQYRLGDLNHMTRAELHAFAPNVFIHLAATFERSTETYEFWDENFQHNVRLSHHLMTLGKDCQALERVVFASSYLIYDPSLYQFATPKQKCIDLREADPISPRNLTGMAKLGHEVELQFIDGFRSKQFSCVSARIFRGYGRGSRDIISRWVRALLRGDGVTVYRPEGMFDYIYAADTAHGIMLLATDHAVRGVINLGTGRSRSVADVLSILRSHFPSLSATSAESDIPFEASQADMRLWSTHFAWRPEHDLEKGIAEIVAYERASKPAIVASELNVLVSSASNKVPLVRAMQHAVAKIDPHGKVTAGDVDATVGTFYVADATWLMPPAKDATFEDIYDGLQKRGIGCVLPTRDGELAFWARHSQALRQHGIVVLVSPLESVERCLDKLAFARFGFECDLPFIPTGLDIDVSWNGPYVVKERFGAGARGIGLKLDADAAREHATRLENAVFQPYVEGFEVSIDAWLDRAHRVKGVVLRRREKVVAGESRVTTTFTDAALEATAIRALEQLQLSGPVVMQAMIDPSGAAHIIECNARFGGASTASIAAGLDSLYWSLLESRGGDIALAPFARVAGQLRQVRVPADIHIHDPDL